MASIVVQNTFANTFFLQYFFLDIIRSREAQQKQTIKQLHVCLARLFKNMLNCLELLLPAMQCTTRPAYHTPTNRPYLYRLLIFLGKEVTCVNAFCKVGWSISLLFRALTAFDVHYNGDNCAVW